MTIKDNLRRWGANMRRRGARRTLDLDETFFDVVDSEEKAYWLGFILADGSVGRTRSGNWYVTVDLATQDIEHLYKLKEALKSSTEVKFAHNDRSAYIRFCARQLCEALGHYGVTPNKTGKHSTPDIQEEFKKHFWRGVIDGDGSLFFSYPNWCFSLTGYTNFLHDAQDWLMDNAELKETKLLNKNCASDISELRYTGTQQVARICRTLYDDATIYLERKLERANQCILDSL